MIAEQVFSGGSRKNIWGPGPSSFRRQQRLSEITTEPEKNRGGLHKIWGACAPWPQPRTATLGLVCLHALLAN